MIWIGILLCLGITSSQGKPLGDAADVIPAEELREADDQQPTNPKNLPFFELVLGKKEGEQMYLFSILKRLTVLVQTAEELNWEEARARCQQLGDELDWTESGLNGDLSHFMIEEYLNRKKDREFAYAFSQLRRKYKQKNPETEPKFHDVWLGKDPRKEGSCMFFYGVWGNYVTSQSCEKKAQAFLCEFSS